MVADFYPLLSNTVIFQRFEIPVEVLLLLEEIVKKYPNFMTRCKLGVSLRKSGLQLLIIVLLDM